MADLAYRVRAVENQKRRELGRLEAERRLLRAAEELEKYGYEVTCYVVPTTKED